MSDSEGANTQPKRSRRPICPNCGQVLSKSLFDRCVWCGAELPEELRLSSEEKSQFRAQQKDKLADVQTERLKQELEGESYSHHWSLRDIVKGTGR